MEELNECHVTPTPPFHTSTTLLNSQKDKLHRKRVQRKNLEPKMLRILTKTASSMAKIGRSTPDARRDDVDLSAWELVSPSHSDDEDLYSFDGDDITSGGDDGDARSTSLGACTGNTGSACSTHSSSSGKMCKKLMVGMKWRFSERPGSSSSLQIVLVAEFQGAD
ncbi:RNA polymerase-associated protein RapA, partial [Striga asiatica]